MLVLSRKVNEGITLDLNGVIVRVTTVRIRGGKVRLRFDAPREVVIHRDEVAAEIAKREAAAA